VHNGQPKPNLRHRRKGAKWVGRSAGNSEFWGDSGSARAGTHSQSSRERIPNCRSYDAETNDDVYSSV